MLLKSPWKPRLADTEATVAERLVQALADDIAAGTLETGDRLPAHRELAWALEIGIGTVTKAYAILERRGLVRGVKGRGTFVAAYQARQGTLIDLSINAPPPILSHRALARSLMAISRKVDADYFTLYASPAGHLEHRRLLARWLETLGLVADPARLVLTGGAQQALALAFDLVCGRDGVILTERLTYPGAITLCRHTGLRMRGVAIDDEGMVPSSLAEALDSEGTSRRRAVYVTPTLHNPTTATMTLARREAIADICRLHDVPIIEDGVYGSGTEGTPIAMLAPERCLHVSSLSKTISPGLRVGVLLVTPAMECLATTALQALPFSPSPLSCCVIEDWLANGTIRSVRLELKREAARRSELAKALLADRTLVSHPDAYQAWLPMPREEADMFASSAASLGIAVTPPSAVMVAPEESDSGVRLCLGGASFDDLTRALSLLSGIGRSTRPL
ncbi:aspartate aminotransferase [Azospirillum sp. TSH100]|uniref:aminotransferase-like domain-containing protein n=1 Tax=Azospirillum sp. TSH100 TaxID=652764 RepID=UPI000D61B43D|nr:PLP-dependent aminotransferase family protein [Azospirillum sp. TSH100]PWC80329.1 aspartate aminotransferase [Azospirillum sp. TSH100]QCG91919.1 PLP-dependent aminotransferase family protein [Azospirillum sp. TSH100]